ncbi:hypothetical protein EYR40_003148 [Pleurotus pulmonarius]|nr:hypothetical protein EYR40_003148 [Pleurotus pulmonarius]
MPLVPPVEPGPLVPDVSSGRPRRLERRLPARYRDDPPPHPPTLPQASDPPIPQISRSSADSMSVWFQTPTNNTGVYRLYPRKPTHDPDTTISLHDIWDREPGDSSPNEDDSPSDALAEEQAKSQPWSPFLNASIARLMCWFHAGSTQKSNVELDTLVKGVLLRDDFNTQDLRGFSTKAEHTRLDNAVDSKLDPKERLFPLHSGWEQHSVKLALPAPKIKQKEADAPVFEVSGVMMRPLLAVMTEAFQGPEFQSFHITPFEECWDPLFQSRDPPPATPMALQRNLYFKKDDGGLSFATGQPQRRDDHRRIHVLE